MIDQKEIQTKTVGDLVAKDYRAAGVFKQYGIDFCCGGKKTVAEVCNQKGVPMAGYQMLVRGEIFRGRYRNSYEKPEAFVPGKVTEVNYELPSIAHTFKKGHRIMVQVQNSWFPLFDRNPQQMIDIYHCSNTDFQKATIRIYSEEGHPSGIKVNQLEK